MKKKTSNQLFISIIIFCLLSSTAVGDWGPWSDYWIIGTNAPPDLTDESPANSSTDVAITSDVSITIEDYDGDSFNWTIECSNGQNNSGNNDINGSYGIVLASLSYNQTYTWLVNVTDGFNWTNATYNFITSLESEEEEHTEEYDYSDSRQLAETISTIYLTFVQIIIMFSLIGVIAYIIKKINL